jgi:hypothetical protein
VRDFSAAVCRPASLASTISDSLANLRNLLKLSTATQQAYSACGWPPAHAALLGMLGGRGGGEGGGEQPELSRALG